ncbi:MAG: DUF2063 domain-containing protein [Armatimonadetes bacterium]|nr:DUF2063 domain-containing protein [Armatimonadota bacterium]
MPDTLERLQQFVQRYIVDPGDEDEAMRNASTEGNFDGAAALIIPNDRLGPRERLDIYRDQYLARMEEALENDFPGVCHFVSHHTWHALVKGYVTVWPSCSYNLNHLSEHFVEYLSQAPGLHRLGFLTELARLEWALCEVFEEAVDPVLTPAEAAKIPPEAWATARLIPVSALRLVAFQYPVSEWLATIDDPDHNHPPTKRRSTWVVAVRHNFRMARYPLTRARYDLLKALVEGVPLADAMIRISRRKEVREGDVFAWFQEWVAAGMFSRVEVA